MAAAALRALRALPVLLALLLPRHAEACGDLPKSETMRLSGDAQPAYAPGDRVSFVCRPGFKPVSGLPTHIVCQDDNTWTPLQEACTRKSCPQIEDPVNGRVAYRDRSRLFGSQAHFTCNEGFSLSGQNTLFCELSENHVKWSADPPQCKKVTCEAPPAIANGRYSRSGEDTFEYGDVVTYSCDPPNGTDPYSLVGESQLLCSGEGRWSSGPPECKVVRCPYPVVENGRPTTPIEKKNYYQASVEFECLDGFYLSGQSRASCGADSTWLPGLPTCTKDDRNCFLWP
ncbi:membrane cofactor protein-like isoform X2 [Erinaceus europaeus]|uniref:Membrane cofactor protein-like isoform X2 n=1 Tax=Erinaceus europaeus TaxID=9365 RepID=A0ABM3WCP8_ERIEU|nr:membrane cofactor protein-like isoform X2 [Erinaceus europaeus]